jgi:hypothetical protein
VFLGVSSEIESSAAVLARLLEAQLYGVRPGDPLTYGVSLVLILGAALLIAGLYLVLWPETLVTEPTDDDPLGISRQLNLTGFTETSARIY